MASFLPPIDTLSLDHTGASPTTLVVDDGIGSMFKDVKGDFPTAADSAITEDPERNVPSPSKANFGLVPKPEGEEVAGWLFIHFRCANF